MIFFFLFSAHYYVSLSTDSVYPCMVNFLTMEVLYSNILSVVDGFF